MKKFDAKNEGPKSKDVMGLNVFWGNHDRPTDQNEPTQDGS